MEDYDGYRYIIPGYRCVPIHSSPHYLSLRFIFLGAGWYKLQLESRMRMMLGRLPRTHAIAFVHNSEVKFTFIDIITMHSKSILPPNLDLLTS